MLAGTIYFYDDKEEPIKEIGVEDYEGLTKDEFMQIIQELGASRVVLKAFYHNHHNGIESVLYDKNIKQT